MDVEEICAPARLLRLVPEWNGLLERAPAATPFQRPEWLLPWWDAFGSGDLFTFAARDEGRLAALAPMFLHSWNGRRQATFLGNGVSDQLDFIYGPACAAETVAAILDALAARRPRWDICDLQDIPPGSPLLSAAAPQPLRSAVEPQYTRMLAPLPPDIESFRARLPHGLKRNLRRYRERLSSCGSLAFGSADEDGFCDAFQALIRLHGARWAAKEEGGMLRGEVLERFHSQAARNLRSRGLARLYTLRLEGAIAAVVYALMDRGTAYSYLGGFDPALARYSPGSLILEYAMEQAIVEGARQFDFLRGDEPYKKDWGAMAQTSFRRVLT